MAGKDYHSLSEDDYQEDSDIDSSDHPRSDFSSSDEEVPVVEAQGTVRLLKQIIESETPELEKLMAEFNSTVATMNGKLKPILEKVRTKQVDSTAEGMSYLEMKYNLLLTYCQFLSVFIALKLEGKPVKDHPVINRLLHIKTLLERLRPLDQKLQYQIDKLVRTAAIAEVTINEEKP